MLSFWYNTTCHSDFDFLCFFQKGERPELPSEEPSDMIGGAFIAIIKNCWHPDPKQVSLTRSFVAQSTLILLQRPTSYEMVHQLKMVFSALQVDDEEEEKEGEESKNKEWDLLKGIVLHPGNRLGNGSYGAGICYFSCNLRATTHCNAISVC